MLLRSLDQHRFLIDLDPPTGAIARYNEREDPGLRALPKYGHYSELDGHLWCLYRQGEDLHFRLDDRDFTLTPDTQIAFQAGPVNHFRLYRGGQTLLELDYQNPLAKDPTAQVHIGATPFAENEDYDFGLFVYNVVNDPGRKNRIYREGNA